MTSGRILSLPRGYRSGILSGMTWGIDTTLLTIALTMSAFYPNEGLLIAGTYICAAIHILFETIIMTGVVAATGSFTDVKKAFQSRGGKIAIIGGLAGGPLAMTCYLLSIEMIGAPITTTITSTYPLIGAFLAFLLLREQSSTQVWIGTAVCVFGILYAGMGAPFDGGTVDLAGLGFALITAIGWGFEAVAARAATSKYGISPKVALLLREYVCLILYILIAPLFLSRFGSLADTFALFSQNWESFAIVAVAACFGAFSMFAWYRSISKIGASRGVCLNASYCVWTIVFVSLWYGITPNSYIVTGSVITILGICLALWHKNLIPTASQTGSY